MDDKDLCLIDMARLDENIEVVILEVRAAASITMRSECMLDIVEIVDRSGLHCIWDVVDPNHIEVTIFKYHHIGGIIREISKLERPLRDWCYGKLFGYSERKISEFLRNGIPVGGNDADR